MKPPASPRLALLLVGALAVAAPILGCGDDEAGGEAGAGGGADRLSKAQLVERANVICARSREKFVNGLANYVPPETREAKGVVPSADTFAGAFEEVGLPAIERQAAELRQLSAMRDDEAFLAYLSALEAALRDVERQDEVTGPEFLSRFRASTRMAKAYGLANCTLG